MNDGQEVQVLQNPINNLEISSPEIILVVDDNLMKRYTTCRTLETAGFTVDSAASGLEALQRVAEQPPALLVLDVKLPDISGFEVCRRVKTVPQPHLLPVLHLSAHLKSARDHVQGLDGGADAYLTLPVEPEVLIATVRSLLRLRRSELERERIAAQLQIAEERLRLAIEAAQIGTWDYNPVNDTLTWDARCRAVFGLQDDAPVDWSVFVNSLHPDDRERTLTVVEAALTPDSADDYDIEYRTVGLGDGGQVRWVHAKGRAYFDPARSACVRFTGTVRDITQQKATEEARTLYESLVENSSDFVSAAHLDGRLFYMNTAARRLVGLDAATDVRMLTRQDLFFPEDQALIGGDFLQRVLGEGHAEAEIRFRHFKTGDPIWVNYGVFAVPDPMTGRPAVIATVTRDIRERKQMEQERAQAAARNERIAETLQRSLLLTPNTITAFPNMEIAGVYEAASEESLIGGDFADVFVLDDQQVAFVVGDVTGKGLMAASYTAEIKFALRAFLRESAHPARALYRLNRYLLESRRLDQNPNDTYVSLALAVVDPLAGNAACASAGAEPPLILRTATGQVEEIMANGPLLAIDSDAEYTQTTAPFHTGDTLALATDGITEARAGRRGAFFGIEGLARALQAAATRQTLQDAADSIVQGALTFAGGRQHDDICLIVARLAPYSEGSGESG